MSAPPNVIEIDRIKYIIFKIVSTRKHDATGDDQEYTLTLAYNDSGISFNCYANFALANHKGILVVKNNSDGNYSKRDNFDRLGPNVDVYYGFPFVQSSPSKGGSRRTFTCKRTTAVKFRRVRSRKMRK